MNNEILPPRTKSTNNLIVIIGIASILLAIYMFVPGYHWAIEDLVVKNTYLRTQIQNRQEHGNMPPVTLDEKRLLKISNYWYIKYVRTHTPMNAVILLPPYKAVVGSEEFSHINDADWVEYFIYPRLCISEDEKIKKPELYAKASYVAIVNGWGYDKLKYKTQDTASINLLAIDKPTSKSRQPQ
jgi:hypothetical protein